MTGSAPHVDWLIVGGGIHGLSVARELLEAGVSRDDIVVADEHGVFLASFRRKARACGMETLRSNCGHHLGTSPFGLEAFAQAEDRADELIPTEDHQPRPTLDLFLDHTAAVIDKLELESVLRQATVTGVRDGDPAVVETTDGPVRAANVVLAVGPGDQFSRPEWARDHPQVEHVWDNQTPPTEVVDDGERIWIVGGATTAAQFATSVAGTADSVILCLRRQLRVGLHEAAPQWLNWTHITEALHSLPPGSEARYDRVRDARKDGTVPPYLERELRESTTIDLRYETITTVVEGTDGLLLAGEREMGHSADRVVLATGFASAYDRPLVRALSESCSLARGYRGMPVLDDETLRWNHQTGECSNIFVTGKLAEGTLGAFAGNIPGARRAAERIAEQALTETPRRVTPVSP